MWITPREYNIERMRWVFGLSFSGQETSDPIFTDNNVGITPCLPHLQNGDQWSQITRIMVHQRNRRIRDQSGFVGSFDAPWSEWSWITDPDPDQPQRNAPLRNVLFTAFVRKPLLHSLCLFSSFIFINNNNKKTLRINRRELHISE